MCVLNVEINKILFTDGTTLSRLILNEEAHRLSGFIPVKALDANGIPSEKTIYLNTDNIKGIEISDEMQQRFRDFITPKKIKVTE